MRRMALAISSILLSAAVLTGCGGGNESQPSTASPPPARESAAEMPSASASSAPGTQAVGPQIVISNMAYTVPPSVRPGQEVTIINNDQESHTITADDNNLFDVRVSGGGGTKQFTAPATPGTYTFHCKYHANMHGVLTVQ